MDWRSMPHDVARTVSMASERPGGDAPYCFCNNTDSRGNSLRFQWPLNGQGAMRRVTMMICTPNSSVVSMASERPGGDAPLVANPAELRQTGRFNGL